MDFRTSSLEDKKVMTLAARTKNGLLDRARAFEQSIEHEISALGSIGPGLGHALELFALYAQQIRLQAEQSWADAPDEALRLANMRALNGHLRERMSFFDSQFKRGYREIPRALAAAVERECDSMAISGREAVLTIGTPTNFSTFVADLGNYLLSEIDIDVPMPPHLDGGSLVLISVPEMEGSRAAWQPIIVGHELGHYLQIKRPISMSTDSILEVVSSDLFSTSDPLPPGVGASYPRNRALRQIANRWLSEIYCDAYSVHRFGAAGVVALAEFLDSVGNVSQAGISHPPGSLRVGLMLSWLGPERHDIELEILGAFPEMARAKPAQDWAMVLDGAFRAAAGNIWRALCDWVPQPAYSSSARSDAIGQIADRFALGIPGVQEVKVGGFMSPASQSDVINAVWLAIARETDKPVNRLALKALDDLDFLALWSDSGGEKVSAGSINSTPPLPGTLIESELSRRMASSGSDRFVVTPQLPGAIGGSGLDVRLGNKFIVFERTGSAGFDALDSDQDPRWMQAKVEKAWGDVFYLHPGELVLASTLEYLVLPGDLTAQVITRSSYGRLGLLSATAVQVHPHFAGCLTLELVNLGVMPMAITPGERVAQLVLSTTSGQAEDPLEVAGKYRYPTGPEFSKIRSDDESAVLRSMRDRFRQSRT